MGCVVGTQPVRMEWGGHAARPLTPLPSVSALTLRHLLTEIKSCQDDPSEKSVSYLRLRSDPGLLRSCSTQDTSQHPECRKRREHHKRAKGPEHRRRRKYRERRK